MQPGRGYIAGAALLIGLGAGWGLSRLGQGTLHPPDPSTRITPTATNSGITPSATPESRPNPPPIDGFTVSGDWAQDFTRVAHLTDSQLRSDAIRILADAVPLKDLPRILELADRSLPDEILSSFLERTFRRAGEVMPLEALRWVERYGPRGLDWMLRSTVVEAWAGRDAASVVKWFEQLPPGLVRSRSRDGVAAALAQHSPQLGLALYRRLPGNSVRQSFGQAFFAAWAQFDAPTAARSAAEWLTSPASAGTLGQVIGTWARRDPDAAIAFLLQLPKAPGSGVIWQVTLQQMSGSNPEIAVSLALKSPAGSQRISLVETVARGWAELDPLAATRWAESLTDPALRRAALSSALEPLAQTDPRAALAIAGRHGLKSLTDPLYQAIAGEMAGRPEEAMKWMESLPTTSAKNAAFGGFIEKWAADNPTTAAAFATNLPPGVRRTTAVATVATALAAENPAAAISWVHGLSSAQEKSSAAQSMIWEFSQHDPKQGLQLIESLPPGPNRDQLLGSLASGWAENDLDGAVEWMKATPAGAARNEALNAISGPWANADPVGAADFASHLPAGEGTTEFISAVAQAWAEDDPKAALAWAQNLESPESANNAVQGIVGRWAQDSPTDALAFARTLTDPDNQKAAVLAAMNSWSENNPQEAAQSLASIPDAELRSEAASGLLGNWAGQDPVAAARWLADQPLENRTDEAVATLASSLAQYEPASAMQWAAAVQDPERRRLETVRLAQTWLQSFPSQAEEWLKNAQLDPQTLLEIEAGRVEVPSNTRMVPDIKYHDYFRRR
jgi:hypothetical protein